MRILLTLLLVANAVFLYLNVQAARLPPAPPPAAERVDAVTRILMLSEVDVADLHERGGWRGGGAGDAASAGPDAAADVPSQAAGPSVDAGQGPCLGLGPLAEDDQAAALAAWLQAAGLRFERRTGQPRELTRYWVYIQPMGSLQQAEARVAELRGQGLSDVQVIRHGNMANTISLGVYRREASMQARLQALRELGVEASVSERTRSVRDSWLDLDAGAAQALDRDALRAAFPEVGLTGMACPVGHGRLLRPSAMPRIRPEATG